MRQCRACGEELPEEHFERKHDCRPGRKATRQATCRVCRRRAERARAERVISAYRRLPCTDCGQTYPPEVMQFDHLPEHTKLMAVSSLGHGHSMGRLRAEIAKCEVVCMACHGARTMRRILEAS